MLWELHTFLTSQVKCVVVGFFFMWRLSFIHEVYLRFFGYKIAKIKEHQPLEPVTDYDLYSNILDKHGIVIFLYSFFKS